MDKLDKARTNADDQMILVQHYSSDRVMSQRGFGKDLEGSDLWVLLPDFYKRGWP